MDTNPFEILSLSKCQQQLLQTYLLKGWQNTDYDDKNICVIGFDYQDFVASLCCILAWMTI